MMLSPDVWRLLAAQRFLSPDGASHSFDSRANGYGRGEGIGIVLLKPLDDALRDNDVIRAVIRVSQPTLLTRIPPFCLASILLLTSFRLGERSQPRWQDTGHYSTKF